MINEIRTMIKELLQEASFGRAKEKMEREEFVLISAFRDYNSRNENERRTQKLYEMIAEAGYSYDKVQGGYSEPTVHGDTETGFHMMKKDKKKGDWEIVRHDVIESSVLITGAIRPDAEINSEDRLPLFELAKTLATTFDQDAFIYGAPEEVTNTQTGETTVRMFIAGYDRSAKAPGDEYRIPESWAGPWTKFTPAVEGDIYFTKVAGKKGKLAEMFYKNAMLDVLASPVKNRTDAMKKQYLIERFRSALRLIETL